MRSSPVSWSLALAAVLLALPIVARAQLSAALDSTFGAGGTVTTPFGAAGDLAYAVVVQPDGKIVAGGAANIGGNDDFALVRYNSNGSIDSTFGTAGRVTTAIGTSTETIYALALQPDGKIIAAGVSIQTGSQRDYALVRYHPDGRIDSTFGTNGVTITFLSTTIDYLYAMALRPDGKILVAGSANDGTQANFTLIRYGSDGRIDTTFATRGMATVNFGASSTARAIALRSDGKIVVAGNANNGADQDIAVAVFDSTGAPFTGFNSTGRATTPIGTLNDFGYAMFIQPDDKIVVAGSSRVGSFDNVALVRFNANGTLDETFGTGGKVVSGIGTEKSVAWAAVDLGPQGILVGGQVSTSSTGQFLLALYTPLGVLDASFGTNGSVITPMGNGAGWAYALGMQPDGKVVLAGYAQVQGANLTNDFAVVRYMGAFVPTGVENGGSSIPHSISLEQNYPNPFNPATQLVFKIPEAGRVRLSVFDLLGREVAVLLDDERPAGTHTARWDAPSMKSGVYFAQLQSHGRRLTKKMTLVR